MIQMELLAVVWRKSWGLLEEFSKADSRCIVVFCKLFEIETCFGWEKPLVAIAKRART